MRPIFLSFIWTSLFLIIFISSCKKFVEVPPPDFQLNNDLVFADDQVATSAIVSMYGQLLTSGNGGAGSIGGNLSIVFGGLYADELIHPDAGSAVYPEMADNTLNANYFMVAKMWKDLYSIIYQANSCIIGLNNADKLTPSIKKQLSGEAYFIRAYCYFYLSNFFGDVPLVTKTDFTINASLPRTPIEEIDQQIISDLKDAQLFLLETYPSAEKVRVNKWAATAMLARVYLYKKDWPNAETMATDVINSGTYLPLPALNDVFLKGSKETIWQLMPGVPNLNTYEGIYLNPISPTVLPLYVLSDSLASAFGSDPRKTAWVGTLISNGTTFYHASKYKSKSSPTITEYPIQLRLSEQYLIRAEALAMQNKIEDAVNDINEIRNRAGATPLSTSITQDDCIAALEYENRIEFFVEMAHRFLDLKRTNRLDVVLGPQKPEWQTTDALYPIPSDQLRTNPFLTQNPGY